MRQTIGQYSIILIKSQRTTVRNIIRDR